MRAALLVFASAMALTLAMAAPVLEAPAERLFGREIVGRHHDAYTMVRQFERPSSQTISQPVTDLAGAAVARFWGGVRAYNILVLVTFPLAALFAFLLARHLGLPAWAAGLSGLAFAFAPSHLAHAAYHPHVAQVQWIPLYLLALLRCLDRWSAGRAALLLLAGGLLVLSNYYSGLFLALLTPVVLVVYRPEADAGSRRSAWLPSALTLLAGGVVGSVYLHLTAGSIRSLVERFAFPPEDLGRYAARWYSYLLPPVDHPLAGQAVWAFWRDRQVADGLVEQQLTLGLGLLALATVAVAACWRRRGVAANRHGVPLLSVLAVAAFLGSLAPLESAGPWPAPAVSSMIHPLLPMFRAYARLGIFVHLAVVLLAAAGAVSLVSRGRRAKWLAAALLALAAIELMPFPPWRWHPVLPTEGHRWMASQPAPWHLLDCVEAPPAVTRSILQFLPQPAAALSEKVADCGEPGLAGKLAARGYTHLLLRRGSADDRWHSRGDLPAGLVEERRFDDSRLLRVTAEPAAVVIDHWRGFSWREYAGDTTFRWLGASGEWQLVNGGAAPVVIKLELELWSLGESRELELILDGRWIATVQVATAPRRHLVGPLRLLPGPHRLAWRPAGPAAVPDELLGNGDRRRLTVAVGAWRWLASAGVTPRAV